MLDNCPLGPSIFLFYYLSCLFNLSNITPSKICLFLYSFLMKHVCVPQAAKILANLIVMGSGILARAFVQAYRQALASK